jgi:glutamine phosphoribosylpyrophosphate amidotransferase
MTIDTIQDDKLRDECGVFGIFAEDRARAVAPYVFRPVRPAARGQESCGIAVYRGGRSRP